ncbi:XdhC family protein [Flavobacteriaceae bacterium XHP0103]|uniref:XdhC family protein n=1 Tax=Marixanthotalea marina TaxID=2844359 RepID=UPI002989AD4C|nr:XdhC family protein [Marixanthotalea marina]MBU3821667.1 XdhC family protein [Marixanthotalea marina]
MTHEFKEIVKQAFESKNKGFKSVLASVVALDGSSYRRPGVRMLIIENGQMVGAVSGGCVEKEILLQSQSVFKSGLSKMMTYDGRYRLGCEGVLYILLELFQPEDGFESAFSECLQKREAIEIQSRYTKKIGEHLGLGSFVTLNDTDFGLGNHSNNKELAVFKQVLPACSRLVIIGAEHDAVTLCKYASLTGWEVTIVAGVKEAKTIDNFPGALEFYAVTPETMTLKAVDNQTSIILMTHSFANDLRFLVALKDTDPNYIGMLGPSKRREDLLNQLIEYCPDIEDDFLNKIHGPAGIDIGSETPQEIAISIMAEILAVSRNRNTISLSKKTGRIHSNL